MGKIQHLLERRGLRVSEDDVALAMETALIAARFEVPYPDPRETFSRASGLNSRSSRRNPTSLTAAGRWP